MSPEPLKIVPAPTESPANNGLITALNLNAYPEGGYLCPVDPPLNSSTSPSNLPNVPIATESTTALYFLTPHRPVGVLHSNKSRIVHCLHSGRARYVTIDPKDKDERGWARVRTFDVGKDVNNGEKLWWIVEGGVWKGTIFDAAGDENHMLISEVSCSTAFRRLKPKSLGSWR